MLRILLAVTAVIAATVLIAYAWHGPFYLGLSVRSPMNPESILGGALILLVLLAPARRPDISSAPASSAFAARDWLAATGLAAAVIAAMWPSLWIGFTADDYAHILAVSKADASFLRDLFTLPAIDRFFRPFGMISYWIDVQWAGFSPVRWHAAGLALHLVNAVLLFALCRRIGLALPSALFAAALFGVHGSRPEAVTWVAARFDLVATSFVLASMLLFLAHVRRPSFARLTLLLAATVGGLLSKESAYVLPLLLMALVALRRDLRNRASYSAIVACFGVTATVFLYRWWLLQSIGGYADSQGRPTILNVNIWLTIKALILRIWAALFFPLNWTDPLGLAVKATLVSGIVLLVLVALRARFSSQAGFGLAVVVLAAVPVQHLLLIGPDLEKSRVIYLSSLGLGIFMAALLQATPWKLAFPAALAIVIFQVAALRHNLATWDRVSRVHAAACDTIAAVAKASPSDLIAAGMPNVHDGVYMLRTGLPECLQVRHGIQAKRLHMVDRLEDAKKFDQYLPLFVWDPRIAHVRRLR